MKRQPLQSLKSNPPATKLSPPSTLANSDTPLSNKTASTNSSSLRGSAAEIQKLTASLKKVKQRRRTLSSSILKPLQPKQKAHPNQESSSRRRSLFKNRRVSLATITSTNTSTTSENDTTINKPQRVPIKEQSHYDESSLFLGADKEEDTLELKFHQEQMALELQQIEQKAKENEIASNLNHLLEDKENISNEFILKIHNSKGEEEDDTINLVSYNNHAKPLPPVKHQIKHQPKRPISKHNKVNKDNPDHSTLSDHSSSSLNNSLENQKDINPDRVSASGSSVDNLFDGLLGDTSSDSSNLLVTPSKKKKQSNDSTDDSNSFDIHIQQQSSTTSFQHNIRQNYDQQLKLHEAITDSPSTIRNINDNDDDQDKTDSSQLGASGVSIDSLFQGLMGSDGDGGDNNLPTSNRKQLNVTSPSNDDYDDLTTSITPNNKLSSSSPSRSKTKLQATSASPVILDSPARNTRNSLKKRLSTPPSSKRKSKPRTPNMMNYDSPARNTRSSAKKRTTPTSNQKKSSDDKYDLPPTNLNSDLSFLSMKSSDYSSLLSMESPYHTKNKSPNHKSPSKEKTQAFHDSPARNTRSRTMNTTYISSSSSSMSINDDSLNLNSSIETTSGNPKDKQSKSRNTADTQMLHDLMLSLNDPESDNADAGVSDGDSVTGATNQSQNDKDTLKPTTVLNEKRKRSESSSTTKPSSPLHLATASPLRKSRRISNNNQSPEKIEPTNAIDFSKHPDLRSEQKIESDLDSGLDLSMEIGSETESTNEFKMMELDSQSQTHSEKLSRKNNENHDVALTSTPSPVPRWSSNIGNDDDEYRHVAMSPKDENLLKSTSKNTSTTKQPISILNSNRKRRNIDLNVSFDQDSSAVKRRTVNFGSPKAAEYNLGSPSMSLTPMHPKTAKAMFSIPEKDIGSDVDDDGNTDRTSSTIMNGDLDSSIDNKENTRTIQLESDINDLLESNGLHSEKDSDSEENIHEGFSTDALNNRGPLKEANDSTATIQLETDINALLQNNDSRNEETANDAGSANKSFSTVGSVYEHSFIGKKEESATVQLELDINALLEINQSQVEKEESYKHSRVEQNKDSKSNESSLEESKDTTDIIPLERDVLELFDQAVPKSPLKTESAQMKNTALSDSVLEPTVTLEQDLSSFLKQATAAASSLDMEDKSDDVSSSSQPLIENPNASIDMVNIKSFADLMSNSMAGYSSSNKERSNLSQDLNSELDEPDDRMHCKKLDFESKEQLIHNDREHKGIIKGGQIQESNGQKSNDTDTLGSIFSVDLLKANTDLHHLPETSKTYELETEIGDLLKSVSGQTGRMNQKGREVNEKDTGALRRDNLFGNQDNTIESLRQKIRVESEGGLSPINADDTTKRRFSIDEFDSHEDEATNTLQLEGNIESLLKTVFSRSPRDNDTSRDFDEIEPTRKPRSKRSSRRISLATPAKRRFSTDKKPNLDEIDEIIISQSEVSLTDNQSTSSALPENFDLTCDEVIEASELLSNNENNNSETDIFLYSCRSSNTSRNSVIVNAANNFLLAVCKEVEGKAEACAASGSPSFSSSMETNADAMKYLQKAVRNIATSSDQADCLEQLKVLGKVVHDYVTSEWAM